MKIPLHQLALISLVVLLCCVFQLLMIDVSPVHAQGGGTSTATATATPENSNLIELETRQHAN